MPSQLSACHVRYGNYQVRYHHIRADLPTDKAPGSTFLYDCNIHNGQCGFKARLPPHAPGLAILSHFAVSKFQCSLLMHRSRFKVLRGGGPQTLLHRLLPLCNVFAVCISMAKLEVLDVVQHWELFPMMFCSAVIMGRPPMGCSSDLGPWDDGVWKGNAQRAPSSSLLHGQGSCTNTSSDALVIYLLRALHVESSLCSFGGQCLERRKVGVPDPSKVAPPGRCYVVFAVRMRLQFRPYCATVRCTVTAVGLARSASGNIPEVPEIVMYSPYSSPYVPYPVSI
ncbi:hypothetical protein BJ875DRAFT_448701 [Amylocarpus encephaloides]|uniref:Uncharacterized protein n=1 Tax=Amylocarpus encephaloides TaxID=45428 RepID=A0A9P7YSX1_9HELO|nr:hypothetical protein BJ875DRAFT_448701 [Amylocarpus encephaloides]